MEARLEKDHFALERWCSHFNSSMAISAVQIWISSAFRLVPTKLFTFKFCLRALKNNQFPTGPCRWRRWWWARSAGDWSTGRSPARGLDRSEEHTSDSSHLGISYAVF